MVCERWVERHILWERTSSYIFFQSQGVPTLALPCKLVRDVPWSVACPHARLQLSKTATWFSSRDPLRLHTCLNWVHWHAVIFLFTNQLHGVIRNEPKTHVICYKKAELKQWIPSPCSKPSLQTCQVALKEHLEISISPPSSLLQGFGKSIWSCKIVTYLSKIKVKFLTHP